VYFIHDGVPTIYIYAGGDNPWEAYTGSSTDTQSTLIPISYSDLKSLVNLSKLQPGQQYRIIDYVTLTKASDAY
jgi:hypothetical protein